MGAIIVILVLVVLGGLVALAWRYWQPQRRTTAVELELDHPVLASPAKVPTEPDFFPQNPANPGFTIVSVSGVQPISPLKNTAHKGGDAATNGFEFVEVTENLSAICKLTGRRAVNCTCDRHKGKR